MGTQNTVKIRTTFCLSILNFVNQKLFESLNDANDRLNRYIFDINCLGRWMLTIYCDILDQCGLRGS